MRTVILCVLGTVSLGAACIPSVTTVSGTHAPRTVCSGQLIFEDDFKEFDLKKWQHENTLAGGGHWEFQWYTNNRTNSFTRDGKLYIRPSLTADHYGEAFLSSGTLNIDGGAPAARCTDPTDWGCQRTGTVTNIINPIKSARIRTVKSFNFRYGKLEVRAKMPAGDWLWPAIWMMPTYNTYGIWPASGEIDLLESRGNRNLRVNGNNIGTQEVASTLQFGPFATWNEFQKANFIKRSNPGFDQDFHKYQLEWTPDYIKFSIDGNKLGTVAPGKGGFWEFGGFDKSKYQNPWQYGSKMAPFDAEFFLIINVAVGGIGGYFPDKAQNPTPKPWSNTSPTVARDFWNGRGGWLPTWNLDVNDGADASLQVDYVRVWAL